MIGKAKSKRGRIIEALQHSLIWLNGQQRLYGLTYKKTVRNIKKVIGEVKRGEHEDC